MSYNDHWQLSKALINTITLHTLSSGLSGMVNKLLSGYTSGKSESKVVSAHVEYEDCIWVDSITKTILGYFLGCVKGPCFSFNRLRWFICGMTDSSYLAYLSTFRCQWNSTKRGRTRTSTLSLPLTWILSKTCLKKRFWTKIILGFPCLSSAFPDGIIDHRSFL